MRRARGNDAQVVRDDHDRRVGCGRELDGCGARQLLGASREHWALENAGKRCADHARCRIIGVHEHAEALAHGNARHVRVVAAVLVEKGVELTVDIVEIVDKGGKAGRQGLCLRMAVRTCQTGPAGRAAYHVDGDFARTAQRAALRGVEANGVGTGLHNAIGTDERALCR